MATIKKRKCYFCGRVEKKKYNRTNIEVHHIDLNHYNNTPKNRVVVCQRCHMKLHHTIYSRLKKVGMLTYVGKQTNLRHKRIEHVKKFIISTLDSLK